MKKTLLLIIAFGMVLAVSSCKRTDIDDPDWDSPAAFYVLLEGSVNPAVLLIDGNIHTSRVNVRVTDSKGNPLPGKTIFLEQLHDLSTHDQIDWGSFENNEKTMKKVTNANGEISITFTWPVQWRSSYMYIHALMVVDDRAYRGSTSHIGNVPEDFIRLTLIQAGNSGAAQSVK